MVIFNWLWSILKEANKRFATIWRKLEFNNYKTVTSNTIQNARVVFGFSVWPNALTELCTRKLHISFVKNRILSNNVCEKIGDKFWKRSSVCVSKCGAKLRIFHIISSELVQKTQLLMINYFIWTGKKLYTNRNITIYNDIS